MSAAAPGYRLRTLFAHSAVYAFSDVLLQLIAFLLVPVYTRAMSPSEYGILAFAQALTPVLGPLIGLGLVSAVPILYHAGSAEDRRRLISTLVNFVLLWGLAMTLLVVFVGGPLFDAYAPDVPFRPYVLLALVTVYLGALFYLPLSVFNMEERPFAYAAYALSVSLVTVAASLFLVVGMGLGALGALWGALLGSAVGAIAGLVALRRHYTFGLHAATLRESLSVSLPALPHLFSGNLWRVADRFFLVGVAALSVAGVYSIAVLLASGLLVVMQGASTALNPLFYRRAHAGDASLPKDWARLMSLFALVAVTAALALALLGPDLLRVLTPPAYHDAAAFLPLLALGNLLLGAYWMLSPGIGFSRRMWAYPAASIPAAGLNLLLNAWLTPLYGGHGAAVALVAASALQLLVFGLVSQRAYRVPYEKAALAKVLLVAGAVFAVSLLLPPLPLLASVAARLGLVLLVPLALLPLGFYTGDELSALRAKLRRAPAADK